MLSSLVDSMSAARACGISSRKEQTEPSISPRADPAQCQCQGESVVGMKRKRSVVHQKENCACCVNTTCESHSCSSSSRVVRQRKLSLPQRKVSFAASTSDFSSRRSTFPVARTRKTICSFDVTGRNCQRNLALYRQWQIAKQPVSGWNNLFLLRVSKRTAKRVALARAWRLLKV